MLDGEPVVLISYSTRFQASVAEPVADRLRSHGLRPILVGEEPLPAGIDSSPSAKVSYFFDRADMAVYLATPDDRLESGEVHTRPNIIDEHRMGLERGHLRHKLLVFKAPEVTLPSNINPVYERLPLDDAEWVVARVVEQAAVWGVLPKARAALSAADAPQSSGGAHQDAAIAEEPADRGSLDQADAAAEALRVALRTGEAEPDELRRVQLAVAGALAERGLSDTLGVHFVNQLFTRRHTLELRPSERTVLLRTYLHYAGDDNVPGCSWFRPWRRGEFVDLLRSLAANDADVAVRTNALALLRELHWEAPLDDLKRLLGPMLDADESRLRWAALTFLAARADPTTLELLDDPALVTLDPQKTASTRLQIMAASDPDAALRLYAATPHARDDAAQKALERMARRVSAGILADVLGSSEEVVRLFGIRLARRRGRLPVTIGRALACDDRSPHVRLAALRALTAQGTRVAQDVVAAALNTETDAAPFVLITDRWAAETDALALRDPAEVDAGLTWTAVDGPQRYEALGRNNAAWVQTHVRADIEDGFRRLKQRAVAQTIQAIEKSLEAKTRRPLNAVEKDAVVASALEMLDNQLDEKVRAFVLRLFRVAAVRLLVLHGCPEDVEVARRFARDDDRDLRTESLRLLDHFAGAEDAALVRDLLGSLSGDEQRRAAALLLRLTPDDARLHLLAGLRSESGLRAWAVEELRTIAGDQATREAITLMWDDDAESRLLAANVVLDRLPDDNHEALLDLYLSHGPYYYNVVRAFDRRIYARVWLRDALTRALRSG